jgi:outer membrane protein assembly factor BamE (lipoprotein component of BamABCDE complex)
VSAAAGRPVSTIALAGLACAACAACTTVGNGRLVTLDESAAAGLLVPGKTTEAEVREALGQGTVVKFQSGWETWHYVYRKGLAKGWDYVPYVNLVAARIGGDEKELVILFDENGMVKRWSLQVNKGGRGASGG